MEIWADGPIGLGPDHLAPVVFGAGATVALTDDHREWPMTDRQDQFGVLMGTLTKTMQLARNTGTEVSDETKARLRGPAEAVDAVRSSDATP